MISVMLLDMSTSVRVT